MLKLAGQLGFSPYQDPHRLFFGGDPGLGLNENWNVAFSTLPLTTVYSFIL